MVQFRLAMVSQLQTKSNLKQRGIRPKICEIIGADKASGLRVIKPGLQIIQACLYVVIISAGTEGVSRLNDILVGRKGAVGLNRAITPCIVNIRADLCARGIVNAYNVVGSLGGSPTDEPSGYFLMQAKFNAFYDVCENKSLRQPLIRHR